MNYARVDHACNRVGDRVIVSGGRTWDGDDHDVPSEVYDLSTDTWGEGPANPGRTGIFLGGTDATYENLIFGGYDENNFDFSDHLDVIFEFDEAANEWREREEKLVTGREHAMVIPLPEDGWNC